MINPTKKIFSKSTLKQPNIIHPLNILLLRQYIYNSGAIKPNFNNRKQKTYNKIRDAIKNARILGLLKTSYINSI